MNEKIKNIMNRVKNSITSAIINAYYGKYLELGLPPRRFIQVNIETNSICTRTCHYCLFGIRKVPARHMSSQLFFNIIDQLVEMHFIGRVSLFEINEPLTDKRIYDFTRYISCVLPRCYQLLVTNGDLLNQERLDALMENGLDQLIINSYDEKSFNKNEVWFKYGTEKYPGRIEHCDKTSFKEWTSRSGHIKQYYAGEAVNTFCEYPNYILYIKPDGKVLACWNDFDEENVMGDLNRDSIREIWYGHRFKRFRGFVNKGNRSISYLCRRCDHTPDLNYMRQNKLITKKKLKKGFHSTEIVNGRMEDEAIAIKRKYLEGSAINEKDKVIYSSC
ncbi:MAG: hypothetical protein A2Y97_03735 [Nitrospirae bacterium RBG_13_39_12]|nr:MAG: hypothetical protein A2Y97_03735 [Nitrospirae bacterium RBG_13_39_12]